MKGAGHTGIVGHAGGHWQIEDSATDLGKIPVPATHPLG